MTPTMPEPVPVVSSSSGMSSTTTRSVAACSAIRSATTARMAGWVRALRSASASGSCEHPGGERGPVEGPVGPDDVRPEPVDMGR